MWQCHHLHNQLQQGDLVQAFCSSFPFQHSNTKRSTTACSACEAFQTIPCFTSKCRRHHAAASYMALHSESGCPAEHPAKGGHCQ